MFLLIWGSEGSAMVFPECIVQISLLVISLVVFIRAKSAGNLYEGKLSFNLGLVISNENNGPLRIRRFENDQEQSARRAKIYEKPILRMREDEEDDESDPVKRAKNVEPQIRASVEKPKKKKEREVPTPEEFDSDDGMKIGGSTRGMRPEEFEPESGGGSSGQKSPVIRGYSASDNASNDGGRAGQNENDDDVDDFRK